jgi:predicted nucleotidyltransferase
MTLAQEPKAKSRDPMTDQAQRVIKKITNRIVRKFHPDKIILFGSYARGEVTRDSDIDLLVIMAIEGSNRQKMVQIYDEIGAVGIPKDVLVYTPAQVRKYGNVAGTTLKAALREGVIVYEKKS